MDNLKFCKDCKYFLEMMPDFYLKLPHKVWCQHPKNIKFDLVNGNKLRIDEPKTLRSDNDKCGESAAWFEPKYIQQVKPD